MSESVSKELTDAIERIQKGKVTSAILVARMRAGKPVKLNYSTVSVESGHSRTLIGYDGCDYDDVRKTITNAMLASSSADASDAPGAPPKSMVSVIERLRQEKAYLKRENSQLASELAAARKTIALLKKGDARGEYDKRRTQTHPSNIRGRGRAGAEKGDEK